MYGWWHTRTVPPTHLTGDFNYRLWQYWTFNIVCFCLPLIVFLTFLFKGILIETKWPNPNRFQWYLLTKDILVLIMNVMMIELLFCITSSFSSIWFFSSFLSNIIRPQLFVRIDVRLISFCLFVVQPHYFPTLPSQQSSLQFIPSLFPLTVYFAVHPFVPTIWMYG